jgi:hypothetical protein
MKPALVGVLLGTSLAAALLAGSCSVSHRSDEYACTKQSDCTGGRVCANNFCVVPGSIDAPASIDAFRGNCPTPCTSCNLAAKTCTIDCTLTSACVSGAVTCPSGYACDIRCKPDGSCRNGVNCQLATSCTIDCAGTNACRSVQCGAGPCDVQCTGASSCRGVSCGASCACDVVCTGNQSCSDVIQCTSTGCINGSGCTSVPAFCHSCK